MNSFFAFGLHIGDLGKRTHPKMDAWILALNVLLLQGFPPVRIVSFFNKSGNFVVATEQNELFVIAERLREASERDFAILPIEALHECVGRLHALRPPHSERDFRPTLGASFRIGQAPILTTTEKPWETKNGHYLPLTQDIVGVWKKDRLAHSPYSNRAETLERNHRDPWGVVGEDIRSKFGGKWTSRSAKTIFGLARCERQPNRISVG